MIDLGVVNVPFPFFFLALISAASLIIYTALGRSKRHSGLEITIGVALIVGGALETIPISSFLQQLPIDALFGSWLWLTLSDVASVVTIIASGAIFILRATRKTQGPKGPVRSGLEKGI